MDADLPAEIRHQLGEMEKAVAELESLLNPFLNKSAKEIVTELTPLQQAEVHLALANSTTTLFNLFLKARGVNPEDHAARKEEERLKQYSKKVRKALAEQELAESSRTLEVDVAALSRFISAAVPDLAADQKKELKGVGMKGKAQRKQERADLKNGKLRKKRKGGADDGHKEAALAFLEETLAEVRPKSTSKSKKTDV